MVILRAYTLERSNQLGMGRVKCVTEIIVVQFNLHGTAAVVVNSCIGWLPTEVGSLEVDEAHHCLRIKGSIWELDECGRYTGLQCEEWS